MNAGATTRSEALEALFGDGVVAFERTSLGRPPDLAPEERACAAAFVPQRVAEFAAGRACAHAALAVLQAPFEPIVVRADRSPAFPAGFVGSISHTRGYAAAVAAASTRYRGLGLDVEGDDRITPDLWQHLFVPDERAFLVSLAPPDAGRAASIAFCAKEAYYKCQFAVTQAWIDFPDVYVVLDDPLARDGAFEIRSAGTNAAAAATLPLRGRYRSDAGRIAAGVALRR